MRQEPFLFGAATSAYQVEGHDPAADWAWYAREGGVPPCDQAVDHWRRWKEDFLLLNAFGYSAYRFSLSWSRIQPEPDRWDDRALDRYAVMLDELHRLGITPLVTLHHFVNPWWISEKGGWEQPETVERFLGFVRKVLDALGGEVPYWITLNEPVVYAVQGWVEGTWPPFVRSLPRAFRVLRHMAMAHVLAYREIKSRYPSAFVGLAKHLITIVPLHTRGPDRWSAGILDALFNWRWLEGVARGTLPFPFGRGEVLGVPPVLDFLGINYYARRRVRFDPRPWALFLRVVPPPSPPRNQMGWEEDPRGLTELLLKAHQKLGVPLWITENGIAVDEDLLRQQFINDHLLAIQEARKKGVPVEGYLYWSLLDNFEWAEGFRPTFGLVRVVRPSMDRIPRPSARYLRTRVEQLFFPSSP